MDIKNFQAFVENLCVPGAEIRPRLNNDQMAVILHAVLGIVSEGGEIADAVKKHIAYGKELDRANMLEEVGDLVHFVTMLCSAMGFTLDQVMEANVKKLKIRYPEGFSTEKALTRRLAEEREVLEREAEVPHVSKR